MKDFLHKLQEILRGKATHITEYELNELENIFFSLLMGSLAGMPSPPSYVMFTILPLMLDEAERLRMKTKREKIDIISELFGILEIG